MDFSRSFKIIRGLCLISSMMSFPLYAEESEQLKAFRAKIHSVQLINLSFYNSKVYLGEVRANVNSDGVIQSIERKSLEEVMGLFLIAEKFNQFKNDYKDLPYISLKQISDFGVEVSVDISNFKVDIKAPQSMLNPNRISISQRFDDQNEINVYPNKFSAFLNYSFNERLNQEEEPKPTKQSTLTGALDPVINFNKNILESHHQLNAKGQWSRTATKLSRDLVNRQMRVSLGDINYLPSYFQTPYNFAGFSLTTAYDITPTTTISSTADREIYLDSPSLVQIYINGFLIQSLTLEAGKHLLEDIPLSQGMNYISIKITDNSGAVRTIVFQNAANETMLKKGFHDFNYSIGKLSDSSSGKLVYKNNSLLSFHHRYGLSNTWTLGGNAQIKNGAQSAGAENIFGSPYGLIIHNLSFSKTKNTDSGVATKFSYVWTKPDENPSQSKRITLNYEYQSPHFLSNMITDSLALNTTRHSLQLIYNQNFTDNLAGIFQTNYNTLNFKKSLSTQYNLGFNYKFIRNLYSNFYWTETINHLNTGNSQTQSVLAQLTYFFGDGKNNIITSYNQNEGIKNYQTEYAYNENKPVNNSIYRARVAGNTLDNNAYLAQYHNWSGLELGTSFEYHSQSKRKEININPIGSIALVDGHIGFGQRINQSFVMIDNELKERVVVNGDQDNYEAKLNSHDRAVLTGVQPYVPKRLSVISDENKLSGFSNNEYRAMAYFKTGTYLKLSMASNRSIEGTLTDENGRAYSLVGAKLINLSSGEETLFFTKRNGEFFIELVRPENYQIIIIDRGQLRSGMLNLSSRLKDEKNNLGKIIINRQ